MRQPTMYVAGALAVVAMGAAGLRVFDTPSFASRPSGGTASVVDAPVTVPPVGPAEVVDGVPHGWRRDGDGAQAAAEAAVRLTGAVATAGFITRSDIIASVATKAFGPTLASVSSSQLTELSAELGSDGVSPGQLVWSEIPLTTRVISATATSAQVEVWAVLVVGVPGSGAPRQAWRTVTVDLWWERGDWRIDGWGTRPGPTPALAATAVVSSVEEIAEVAAWTSVGGGT